MMEPHAIVSTRREFAGGLLATAAGVGLPSLAADSVSEGAERAIVFNVEKFATHDGPGIRTVVFLKGCPLRCRWCHSPESWSYAIERYSNGETIGREMSVDEVFAEVIKDRDFYEASKGGVTLSGGEPLAHPDFCGAFLARLRSAGIHTAIETSGFAKSAVVEQLLPFVDLWLYDVKELDAAKYQEYTARPLKPSLDNLQLIDRYVRETRKGVVILRCPMIPGLNDDPAELQRIGKLADSLDSVAEINVEPYVPYGIEKAKRLGLKVYEAPQPPVEYGPGMVMVLKGFTKRKVVLG